MRPVITHRRLNRAALLRSTALQAVVGLALAAPALAQPAPNARPLGGQVVAGSASIARTATATTIAQSTNRAAIDWRGFDVGSQQNVTFQQPSNASVTLNRVTGGDPSAIAGRITANGQIVLTNRSGVTFYQGAQINAQSVIVSAADISNQNFMAGRMVFDRAAKPNARVENRGTITVKQAGLAALVAPSVANSGVIDARLGQVVLAGAVAHTLDMYGDGLVSIDVTRQVIQVPTGPDGKAVTALVTNTGIITADGGVVQLTATAADGVVQTLVRAGGHIRADTVGGRTGRIEVAGTGGSVVIEGRLAADGHVGGEIMVAGSDTTALAPSARVTANGRAGGGTIAVGTTLARVRGTGAAPAETSARTLIASGARVSADATVRGNGGRITVLSTRHTSMDGALTTHGGKSGGNGGTIEMSGELGFSLAGTADTSAPHGVSGTILLDPRDLVISTAGVNNLAPGATDPNIAYSDGGTGADAFVTPTQIQALDGNVRLQATRNLTVASPVAYGHGNLILEAGNDLNVNAGVTVTQIGGSLSLLAGSSAIPGFTPTGALNVNAAISANNLTLQAAAIALNADVTATILSVNTPGALTQGAGTLTATTLEGTAGSVSLTSRANAVSGLATGFTNFDVTGAAGNFTLVDSIPLVVGSPSTVGGLFMSGGGIITLQTDSLALNGLTYQGAPKVLSNPNGAIVLTPFTTGTDVLLTRGAKLAGSLSLTTTELGETSAGTLRIGTLDAANVPTARNIVLGQAGETINLGGNVSGLAELSLLASGAVTQGGPLTIGTLDGQAGSVALGNITNSIQFLKGFTTTAGDFSLATRSGLLVTGDVIANGGAGNVSLLATSPITNDRANENMLLTSNITGATVSLGTVPAGTSSPGGGIAQTGGVITAATLTGNGYYATLGQNNAIQRLGAFQTDTDLLVRTALPLSVTGAVSATGTLTLNANGLTQTVGSSISAFELDGTSTAATVLNNASNGIGSIGAFTQTGGDLAITSNVAMLGFGVNNTVVSGTGSLSFTADAVGLFSSAGIVTPGTVSFAPLTAGRRMELIGGSAADPNSLSLNQAFLNSIQAGTLQLGAAGASGPINIANLGETVTLTGIAGTLNLLTSGAVTQGSGGVLAVGTLTGNTGGVNLSGGNQIGTLGAYTAAGDLILANTVPLIVAGPVLGATSVQLLNTFTTTVAGNVTAPNVKISADAGVTQTAGTIAASGTLELDSGGAVTQSGGAITAGTLTGNAGSVAFGGASNAIALLSNFTSGPFTLADTRDLTIAGYVALGDTSLTVAGALANTGVLATGALTLHVSGAVTDTSGSNEYGATLSGAVGSLNFANGNFTTLGGLTGTGGVTLVNAGSLTIAGPVVDGSLVNLSAVGGLTITGSIAAPTIQLTSLDGASGFGEGGFFSAPGVLLQTAGTIRGGNIAITSSDVLTLSGGVIAGGAGPVTLSSNGPMTLGNPITGGAISLTARDKITTDARGAPITLFGAIGQPPGGSITATSLTGAADRTVSLLSGGNAIGRLGGFASVGGFALADGQPLSVTGPLSDATSVTLSTTGSLSLAGSIQTGALSLVASGIAQPGGSVVASSLTGRTGAAGAALTQTGNRIGTLLAFASGGDLSVTDGTPVSIAGPVSAGAGHVLTLVNDAPTFGDGGSLSAPGGTVALVEYTSGGGITLGGSLGGAPPVNANTLVVSSAGGPIGITSAFDFSGVSVLDLEGGAIAETGAGSLRVATLTGHGTSASLGGANQIGSLGLFTTTGGFALANAAGLTVSGPLNASTAALSVTGDLVLASTISAPGAVSLVASGAITQPAGGIVTGSLSGSAATAALSAPGNRIAALAGFVTTGDFSLFDGRSLAVTGPVDPNTVTLTVIGDLAIDSVVTGGRVALSATGAITEGAGGQIVATTLTGTAASADLGSANQVTTLGGFATSGALGVTDARGLTVTGPLSASTIGLNVTGDLALAGTLSAGNGLSLVVSGAITQPGGAIAASSLSGNAASASLSAAGNQVAALGGFNGTGAFPLADTGGLAIDGTLAGNAVSLAVTGAITEGAGGRIVAATLDGSAASAALGGANSVTALGGFTTVSGFALANTRALSVTGPVVDGQSIALSAVGVLTLASTIQAPSVNLVSTNSPSLAGGINQIGGVISAATLTGSSTGLATLVSAGNAVATLGGFGSVGGFKLADAQSLSVTGPVSDPTSVALSVAGSLSLAGTIQTGALSLVASGGIAQPGGNLVADSLTGSAGAAGAALTQGGNQIGALLGFASLGDLSVTDGMPVALAGTVSAGAGRHLTLVDDAPSFAGGTLVAPGGTVTLLEFTPGHGLTLGGGTAVSAATLVVGSAAGGPVGVTGAVNLPNVSVLDLESGGAIVETGPGSLHIATLTGHGASASLGGANQIGTLGLFATTNAFALTNAAGLTVSGPLSASTAGLNVTGDLALTGTVSAPGGVSLVASGAITQPAGGIVAGSLSGRAASASLGAAGNQIAVLAGFVTSGDFSFADGRSLAVTGLVDPNTVSLAVTGDLALNSLITGGTVALAATGAITEGATGQIIATTLTGSATSAGLGAGNRVATLGRFTTPGAFELTDAQNLAVAGPLVASAVSLNATGDIALAGNLTTGSLTVSTPGALTQTGGSLAVITLGGQAGGQIDLGGVGTANVANVVGLSSGTGVALVGSGPLRLSGTLSAPNVAVTATGSLTLDGGTIVADGASLQVVAGTAGTASFQQAGITVIQPLTGLTSTVRLGLAAPRATMTLNGLYAPNSDIVLSLLDGRVTGNLLAGNLSVLGGGGSASLTGSVASRFGVAAAIASRISPRVSQLYTLNGCAIGAVSCGTVITSILTDFQITSVLRPDILTLDILDLAVTRDRDDPTLVLPNISDRDY